MMITAENRIKKQKNGNVHHYVYYRCSRKSKTIKCQEHPVRQEILDKQISSLLLKFSLKQDWAEKLLQMTESEKDKSAQSFAAFVQENRNRITEIQNKLQRLLDGYLEQDIEREIYREEKAKLLSEKKSLEEKISGLEQKRLGWVEPMQNWINYAKTIGEIADESDFFAKKVAVKEIFGLNLVLANREARVSTPSGNDFPLKTHWAALCAASENLGKFPESQIIVSLFNLARTHFIKNS